MNLLNKGSEMIGNKTNVKLRDYALYSSIYPAGDCVMRVLENNMQGLVNLSGCGRTGVDYAFDKIMSKRDPYHKKGLYKIGNILRGGSNPTLMQLTIYGFVLGVSVGDLFDPIFNWRWGVDFELGELYRCLRNNELTCKGGDDEFIASALKG